MKNDKFMESMENPMYFSKVENTNVESKPNRTVNQYKFNQQ